MFLQRVADLDAVADGDVADQAALVEQDPRDPVEGFLAVLGVAPARRLAVSPEPGEPGGIEPVAGLFQQNAGPVTQQPGIPRTQDLAGQHHPHRRQQIGMNMSGWPGRQGRDFASYQVCPRPAFSLGAAGQPAFLPGPAWLVLQPAEQRGQSAPHAPADIGAAGPIRRIRQPLHQGRAGLLRLGPGLRPGPGRILLPIARGGGAGDGGSGRRRDADGHDVASPLIGTSPNRACNTSGR